MVCARRLWLRVAGAPANSSLSDGNLYVGTSASELLHFFRIPPDPNDPSSPSTFILASRLPPVYSEPAGGINGSRPGVQQILLLPRVGKACVLCNWTVTFYSLPELSPVFGATQVRNCNWIGGVDLNESGDGGNGGNEKSAGVTILLSLNRRIQVVRIGEEDARVLRVCCLTSFWGNLSDATYRKSTLPGAPSQYEETRLRALQTRGTMPCWMSTANSKFRL